MPNEKRLEELKRGQEKLKLLAEAIMRVKANSTAREILEEVLSHTADGTGTDVADLHDMLIIAYAHSNARVAQAEHEIAAERAA